MYRTIFTLILSLLFWNLHAEDEQSSISQALAAPFVYHSVNVITGEYTEVETDFREEGAYPLILRRGYTTREDGRDGWHFTLPLIKESDEAFEQKLPNGKISLHYDENDYLKNVSYTDKEGTKVYRQLNFNFDRNGTSCFIKTDTGQSIKYTFDESENSRFGESLLIKDVILNDECICSYTYTQHPSERRKVISRRECPDGQYLINEYYSVGINKVGDKTIEIKDPYKDLRVGMVKLQKAPVGPGGEEVIINRYFYHHGYTEVYDALGNKRVFRFDKDFRLKAIDFFLTKYDGRDQLYRKELYFWNLKGRLTAKALQDHEGNTHKAQKFCYNSKGYLIEETLYGHLSGKRNTLFTIDENGKPEDPNIEKHTVYYEYSKDEEPVLLRQYEDGGKEIYYTYDKETKQLISKTKESFETSYKYDCNGHPIETIVSDGGLSQKITKTVLVEDGPAIRKPCEIREYVGTATDKELIKKTELDYDENGNLICQSIYSSNNVEMGRNLCTYDTLGRCTGSENSKGDHAETTFDARGNVIKVITTLEDGKTTSQQRLYDQSNRLVYHKEIHSDGLELATTYQYDLCGNQISSTDIYGNTTEYEYDPLGRLVKTIFPPVHDENGNTIRPTVEQEYDIFDRVVSTVDTKGFRTRVRYNSRGKPVLVVFPDGTKESHEYNLDGTLRKKIDRNGTGNAYEYDVFNRITKKTHLNTFGQVIAETMTHYNGFNRECSIDAQGIVTYYSYDTTGNVTGMEKILFEGIQKTFITRDETGKVIEARIEDDHGPLFKTNEKKENETPNTLEKTFSSTVNALGQKVQKVSVTNEKGMILETTMDALSRAANVVKINPFGQIISRQDYCYDPAGNKVKEIHTVYSDKGANQLVVNGWEYGPGNRLEAQIEAQGSIYQKRTDYSYDRKGRLSCVTKPNGVKLERKYDSTGKIERLTSSDGTIDYHYTYDLVGRVINVSDRHSETHRSYTSQGCLKKEQLGNGLTLSNTYDLAGRKTSLTLPDNSSIAYTYDTAYLREIKRISSKGDLLYHQNYSHFDEQGKLLKADLICDIGSINYTRDSLGRPIEIKAPSWKESLYWDDEHLNEIVIDDTCGSFSQKYHYDSNSQLTGVDGNNKHSYDYDSLFNRLNHNGNVYVYNELNQLLSVADTQYAYDTNGNLIEESSCHLTKQYEYDALERLTTMIWEGSAKVTMTYDPFNRRLSKSTYTWDPDESQWIERDTEWYLYDGDKEIGTATADGDILSLRVLGIGLGAEIGATIAIENEGHTYAPIHDHRGSIISLIDTETKETVESYRYTAFGEETLFDEDGEKITRSNIGNCWRFSGKRIDPETGLIYFGKRYYTPQTGRWLTQDPLGFPDGPNRYAYVQNNPTNQLDLYGLFSVKNAWNSFTKGTMWFFDSVNYLVNYCQSKISYSNYLRPNIEYAFQMTFGKYYLHMTGFYDDAPETGVYGSGELHDKVRVTLINGILNARNDYHTTLEHVSETHGGINVHYIFRPTLGWTWDILKSFCAKMGYVTPQARQLANTWKGLIDEMGGVDGGGLIVHYAHSIGGTDTYAAKNLLTPEEQKMIRVITLGSPTLIPDDGFQTVINYVSRRDGVCLLDPISYLQGIIMEVSHIIYVGTSQGIPFIDHTLEAGTYWDIIEHLGQEFLDMCDNWGTL